MTGARRGLRLTTQRPASSSSVVLAGVDQVISGATNTLFVLFVGRSLSLSSFGALAVALIVYGLVLQVLFSVVTEPAVREIVSGTDWKSLSGVYSVSSLALALSTPIGLLALVLALNETTSTIAALLIGLGGLLLHETIRQTSVGAQRVDVAIVADLAWLLSSMSVLAVVETVGPGVSSAPQALGIWASGAWFGAAVVVVQHRLRVVRVRRSLRWLRSGLRDRLLLSIDPLLTAAVAQVVLVILVAGAGLEAIGLLRTVELAFGFVGVAVSATRLVGQPAYLRLQDAPARLMGAVNVSALAIAGVVAATAAGWIILPQSWTDGLLGERAEDLSGALAAGAFYVATRSIPAPPFLALRAMNAVGDVLVLRLWSVVLQVVSAAIAVAVAGDSGRNLILILSIGYLIIAASCWVALAVYLRRGRRSSVTPPDDRSTSTPGADS